MEQLNFAQRLRLARMAKGISQYALSLAINVHERTVVAWEAGDHIPDEANMRALQREFGSFLDDRDDSALATLTMDELLAEIDRRGYNITLTSKNAR